MTKKMMLWILPLTLVSALAQAQPTLTIRILEKKNFSQVQCAEVKTVGWTEIKLSRGILTVNGKPRTSLRLGGEGGFHLKSSSFDRHYPGTLVVSRASDDRGKLLFINEVPFAQYVACVTASESGFDESQPEYLKTLAVVVREYARGHLRRHTGYDLCDLAHCQVYQGTPPHFDFWEKIAASTEGFKSVSSPNSYYFHRCCGGVLESADQVWGGKSFDNTRKGPDEADGVVLCRSDPLFRWKTEVEVKKIAATFQEMAGLPKGSLLTGCEVTEKTPQGRDKTLTASFNLPNGHSREVRENAGKFISEFGKRYGWRVFPSNWFEIKKEGEWFRFSGHGMGHGVGLCQSGALKLAQMGWSWRQILKFYFPKN